VSVTGLNPNLPRDVDFILRKTLRYEPEERYASASAFASDIQAFLENRPVGARAGNLWYRARKFTRRYWIPVSAIVVAMIGLSTGLFIANRERLVAEERFSQVRDLSNQIFKLDEEIRDLPGATKARHALVTMSLQYLERLARETHGDKQLAMELGSAYLAVARVQGVPGSSNLGELAAADETLRRASLLVEPIVSSSPGDRAALLESAEIAHDRMILADTRRQRDRSLEFAQTAADKLNALLGLSNLNQDEASEAAHFLINVALENANLHRYDDAARLARKGVEVARLAKNTTYIAPGLSMLSNALLSQGHLEDALKATEEARAFEEQRPEGFGRKYNLIVVIWREGRLLGQDDEVNLNRPEQAAKALQTAYDMADELMQNDPGDYAMRARFVAAARDLADILRHSDPARALAVYDGGLRRVAEFKNTESIADRVRLLAGSSYPLRKLHRTVESKQRIDLAFDLLRQTKAWPAPSIRPGNEAGFALRALADYYADTGRLQDAIDTYRDLLEKILASKPAPDTDFRDANSVSVIEAALTSLERKAGHVEAAAALDRGRRERWQRWDKKLPDNSFVERQLAAIALK
jgi:tetratricopeptide (TPR) repeat protein